MLADVARVESVEPSREMRLDELAREAGVATTTVRLYQTKGLLPGPRLVGRTGWYDDRHLARLQLIGRLQEEGFSLAGIARLLEAWQEGRDIDDLVGVERQLDALLDTRRATVLDAAELAARFPERLLTPEVMRRALRLGLIEMEGDGRFRVPDERFLSTGAALADLGLPVRVILDEWERLVAQTDEMATRFVAVFEKHLLPKNWRKLEPEELAKVAADLRRLQQVASQVVAASLDASISRRGSEKLSKVIPDADWGGVTRGR